MQLSKLVPSTKKKGRWLCHLEDGSILRVAEGDVVDFSLYAGMELDEETMARLTAAAQISQAKDRALSLLTARPHARRELIQKLVEREIPPAEAEVVADWLEGLGLLNDEAYAQTLVRHYAGKGYGTYKIRDELYRRGVPKDLWDGALAQLEDSDGEAAIDALLRQKLRGVDMSDRKVLKRVTDALARRGYRWDEIGAALRRNGAQAPDEE